MDTQLPFPYVHLITFIVNVQNLTLAVKCGAAFAVAMAQNNIEVMIGQVIIVLLVGTVYQGLLSISYVVQDPFGEDLLHSPLNYFAQYVTTMTTMEAIELTGQGLGCACRPAVF